MIINGVDTDRKDTNALESSNILMQILNIRMNLMPCCNSRLEHIFCWSFLEIGTV
jgi:hypothetical protein